MIMLKIDLVKETIFVSNDWVYLASYYYSFKLLREIKHTFIITE